MSRRHLIFAIPLFAVAVAGGGHTGAATQAKAGDSELSAVRTVIEAQADAWNRGDVAGYMDGYAKDDSTTFISGDRITKGWQPVLERYKASYNTREKMGTLAFSELEFTPLCGDYVKATGRWQLTTSTGTPHGRFTLLFRRTSAGWRIVHDHTSSAP